MFDATALMPHEQENLKAHIRSGDSRAIMDWLLSPMRTERDVLYLKSVPTLVEKKMTPFEFSGGKWWMTRVVLTRDKVLTMDQLRENAHALYRAGAIISCSIQVENPVVFKLLGFHYDGMPKLIPVLDDLSRGLANFAQVYPAYLTQVAPIIIKDFESVEAAEFPYTTKQSDVTLFHQEYAAKVAGSQPESECVSRRAGTLPVNDLNINDNNAVGTNRTPNSCRTSGTFFPPSHNWALNIENHRASGAMTREYRPTPRPNDTYVRDSLRQLASSSGANRFPRERIPRPPTNRWVSGDIVTPGAPTLHRQTRPLFRGPRPAQFNQAATTTTITAPSSAPDPITITIRSSSSTRSVISNKRTASASAVTEGASQDNNTNADPVASGSGVSSNNGALPAKKRKVTFDLNGPVKQEQDEDEVFAIPGPSRILDDSAIMERGPAAASIDLEDSDEAETAQITIVAELLPRKKRETPVITLSSDSSINNSVLGDDTDVEETSASSDSALPRSDPESPMFNSSDDQYVAEASMMAESMAMSISDSAPPNSPQVEPDTTMEDGEIADDENENSTMMIDESGNNATIEEANMLAKSDSGTDKSESESDTSKDRKAGQ